MRQQLEDDARAFGISPSQLESALSERGDEEPEGLQLFPENWPIFIAFSECCTQWRWLMGAARAVRTGLDYAGVAAVLDSMPWITDRVQAMSDIRIMERAALEVFNEG